MQQPPPPHAAVQSVLYSCYLLSLEYLSNSSVLSFSQLMDMKHVL